MLTPEVSAIRTTNTIEVSKGKTTHAATGSEKIINKVADSAIRTMVSLFEELKNSETLLTKINGMHVLLKR